MFQVPINPVDVSTLPAIVGWVVAALAAVASGLFWLEQKRGREEVAELRRLNAELRNDIKEKQGQLDGLTREVVQILTTATSTMENMLRNTDVMETTDQSWRKEVRTMHTDLVNEIRSLNSSPPPAGHRHDQV